MSLHPFSREQKLRQIEMLHLMATTSKENSNVKNPFYGSVFWQRNSSLYSFTRDGIEGFCPYVLKHIIGGVTNPEEIRFDPTTSGGRLSGLHEETFHENTSIRLHTTTDYEFEY